MQEAVLLFSVLFIFCSGLSAQKVYTSANVHSHNDYEQELPFYQAYARGFGSIEADLWMVDDELYVAHDQSEIRSEEHTSELQSRGHLVCRLLLETKTAKRR